MHPQDAPRGRAELTPEILARRIVTIIQSRKIDVSTEAASHAAIAAALCENDIHARVEVRLSDRDRIDVLAGSVGVEIKTAYTRREIMRQLKRYSEHDRIEALVLATAKPWPGRVDRVGGKPLFVASLSRGWL